MVVTPQDPPKNKKKKRKIQELSKNYKINQQNSGLKNVILCFQEDNCQTKAATETNLSNRVTATTRNFKQ